MFKLCVIDDSVVYMVKIPFTFMCMQWGMSGEFSDLTKL